MMRGMGPRLRAAGVALLAGLGVLLLVLGTRGIGPFAGRGHGDREAGVPVPGAPAADPPAEAGGDAASGRSSDAGARLVGSGPLRAPEPWELAVRVTRRPADEHAVAAPWPARVRLVHRVGAVEEVLGEAVAGADGVAILDLAPLRRIPTPAIESSVSVRVNAERSAPEELGAEEWRDVRPPPEGPARVDLEVELEEARCVRGRVTDGAGRPVAGAQVRVENRAAWFAGALTDGEGRYELGVPAPPLEAFRLVAEHAAFGVATSPPVAGDTPEPAELADLVLSADAGIAGEVSWPNGAPAADVEMEAVRSREDDVEGGSMRGSASTDARGRFRLPVTAGHRYEVGPVLHGDDVPRLPALADGPPLRFVLDAYRLRVRVRDAEGRPVPGTWVVVRRIPNDLPAAWARGEVRDEPLPQPVPWLPGTNYRAAGPEAEVRLLVPAGNAVLVSAPRDMQRVAEAAVEALGAAGERTIDLVLWPRSASGTIRVVRGAPAGAPAPAIGYLVQTLGGADLSVGYLDAEGRVPVPLPVGSLALTLVTVSAQSAPEDRSSLTYERPWSGDLAASSFPWRGLVRVQPQRETLVTPTFRRGARVRIRVEEGPGELAGTEVFARRKGTEVDVPLRRFGRQAIAGEGDFWVGEGLARPQVTSEDLLEPGEYVFRFRSAEGGAPVERPAILRAGEVTEIVYEPR